MSNYPKVKKFNAWHIRFVAAKNVWELFNARSNAIAGQFASHKEADQAWETKVAA